MLFNVAEIKTYGLYSWLFLLVEDLKPEINLYHLIISIIVAFQVINFFVEFYYFCICWKRNVVENQREIISKNWNSASSTRIEGWKSLDGLCFAKLVQLNLLGNCTELPCKSSMKHLLIIWWNNTICCGLGGYYVAGFI